MTKIVAIVHGGSKVPGGVVIATRQTSMVSTMGDYTHMLMVLSGTCGRNTTLSNSLRWKMRRSKR